MKRRIFLDTSYLIALIRKKDVCHAVALEAAASYTGPFLTTDLILIELANSLSKPPYRKTAVAVIEKIQADSKTAIVPFTSKEMSKAFFLFKSREDQTWSIVDCFSFEVMKEQMYRSEIFFFAQYPDP